MLLPLSPPTSSPRSETTSNMFLVTDTIRLEKAMLTRIMSELRPPPCSRKMFSPTTEITMAFPKMPNSTKIRYKAIGTDDNCPVRTFLIGISVLLDSITED